MSAEAPPASPAPDPSASPAPDPSVPPAPRAAHPQAPPRRGVLVTGTDTEVGKSVVTAALISALVEAGVPVAPRKPVESGTDDSDGVPVDCALLAACAGVPIAEVHALALPEPLAPTVAAERADVPLSIEALDAVVTSIPDDVLAVVEGVGGALVEVARGTMVADLPARWGLPVLVVAANRLGVLSHTLLTVEALQSRGAHVLGVVLNTVHEGAPSVAEQTNHAELRHLLAPYGVPLWGPFPFLVARDRPSLAAAARATVPDLIASCAE